MKEAKLETIRDVVTAMSQGRERVVAAASCGLTSVSLGTNFAVGIASVILSGGMFSVTVKPRPAIAIVTDQRLLLLRPGFFGGPTDKVLFSAPLQAVAGIAKRTKLSVFIMIEGRDKALRLQFPLVRLADGNALVEALGVPVLA